jgi:hypothetical protein
MRCDECKYFNYHKPSPKWLRWTGEYTWGYCHRVPEQPPTYKNGWCAMYESFSLKGK